MTALDLMADSALMQTTKNDFDATLELSKSALARSREKVPHSHPHVHGGCGCA